MYVDVTSLSDNAADLKNIIDLLSTSYKNLEQEEQKKQVRIDFLEERIRLLQKELFGRKTEKQPKGDLTPLPIFCRFHDKSLFKSKN